MDTARVNLLNKVAYKLFTHDPEKSKNYANQSLKLSTELNYPKGKAASLWIMGLSLTKSDKAMALKYFKQALHIAEQVKDQTGICNYLMAIGNISNDLGDIKTRDLSFNRALQIAPGIDDKSIYVRLLYNIAHNLSSEERHPEAVEKFQQIVDIATEIDDKQMLLQAYSSMAVIFQRQGNSVQALDYYLSALQINEQQHNQKGVFFNLVSMAGIKSEQNEYQAALETINQAFRIAKEMNDSAMISICLTNTGNVYHQMKHPDALRYFQEALEMIRGNKIDQKVNLLMNIGSIYTEQGKFVEAEESLNKALDMAQKAKIKFACGQVLKYLGSLSYAQKQYIHAINYANRALQISNEVKYMELRKDSYKLLSDIYATTGDYKSAYHNHTLFKQLNDSAFNESNVRKIALMESTYKYNKEKQKYELEKANQQLKIEVQYYFILFLIVITLLVIILSYQLYLSNRLKKKALRLEIEQVNSQLEYSRKEMASATLKLVQNSESDTYCIKMLNSIETNINEEGEKNVRSLISYYKNKSVYSNWEEFETLFLKVNANFYDKLNEQFPMLTLNERKLCVFMKLNMTNKDIAQITFQSEEALKKARMRLRKKLNLDRDENLSSFMQLF